MPDLMVDEDEDLLTEEWLVDDIDEGVDEGEPGAAHWHAVLAPEGVVSGDGRMFSVEALTWRDLPLPLRWQRADTGGHDGAVVVGTIERAWRAGSLVMAEGTFLEGEGPDEVIGQIAEGAVRGVSVDVDDAELASDGSDGPLEFAKGRICAATIVAIPAFSEAVIALGLAPQPEVEELAEEFKDYNAEQRRRLAEKGHALPDGSFPIANEQDLRNAIQAIGRAKDPAKAKAHIKKRARALGHSDLIPEGWAAEDVDEFGRGPGWLTHPVDTRRLHAYWTQPGHKGYAKIRWGTPGDFRRLRRALSKYVEPIYLNRVAAQWHHDALGYWPGECGKPGNPPCGLKRKHAAEDVIAASVNLVAAPPQEIVSDRFFDDPCLQKPTPLTIVEDCIFGHLALWGTCHIGIQGTCTTPPHSPAEYAYFSTGAVLTDSGLRSVGQITMNTGHAGLHDNARAAASHYDNTGTVVADIVVGEDKYGIWFSGVLRPEVTEDQIHTLQAGALSGDWRSIGGHLELVAALVVNVPGFPVPRTALAASGGEQLSLVASCIPEKNRQVLISELVDEVTAELGRRSMTKTRVDGVRSVMNVTRISALDEVFVKQ